MPLKEQYQVKTLTIDGKECGAGENQTILEVARENGVNIPTLCHLDGLTELGACRLCLVEIKGSPKLLPACHTQVQEGMEVTANSPKLHEYRKMVVEMLFSERNHICAVCVSRGHCELQTLAETLGITHVRFPYLHPKLETDGSHARFMSDHNRCVLCGRCVRVCDEVEGAHVWDMKGRGFETRTITSLALPWGDAHECTECGKCVNCCPTGALSKKGQSVAEMAKSKEFLPYLQLMREGGRQ